MIYTRNSDMNKTVVTQSTCQTISLPTTVMEIASTSEPITVLDLSNPSDVAMVAEAGYSILDLSASMTSNASEYGSSDTISIATDDFSDLDPDIAKAAYQAAESGSLIPLLKEELKYNIQKKRLEQGKDILKVELGTKRRNNELTQEEEERRKRRRENNKVAAQKCRTKRREIADILETESSELVTANNDLKKQIQKLEEEKEMLRNMLRTHDICPRTCNVRLSNCSDDDDEQVAPSRTQSEGSASLDPDDMGVQMELEICSSPVESPFAVHLMGIEVEVEYRDDEEQDEDICTQNVFRK